MKAVTCTTFLVVADRAASLPWQQPLISLIKKHEAYCWSLCFMQVADMFEQQKSVVWASIDADRSIDDVHEEVRCFVTMALFRVLLQASSSIQGLHKT